MSVPEYDFTLHQGRITPVRYKKPNISSENSTNDEGSTFCTVTLDWGDETEVHRFSHYFDDGPGESAVEQASSFVGALLDSLDYTLEERLGPYGLEWQREQEDRLDHNDLPW